MQSFTENISDINFEEFPDGVYSVMVTPFDSTNNVNHREIEKWVIEQLESNCIAIVLNGTTSESPTVTHNEKIEIFETVRNIYLQYYHNNPNKQRKMICIGVGTNSTETTIEFATKCKKYCHSMMVVMPYYNKPPQRGIVEHFKAICNHSELRNHLFLLYNVPGRTGSHCLPETVKKIFDTCPNARAIKEASGNPDNTEKIVQLCRELNVKVFSGDDKIVLDMLDKGARGLISVASNVFPNMFAKLVATYFENPNEARNLYITYRIAELCDAMFIASNPIPVKRMMLLSGRYSTDILRLPLVQLDPQFDEQVNNAYFDSKNNFTD